MFLLKFLLVLRTGFSSLLYLSPTQRPHHCSHYNRPIKPLVTATLIVKHHSPHFSPMSFAPIIAPYNIPPSYLHHIPTHINFLHHHHISLSYSIPITSPVLISFFRNIFRCWPFKRNSKKFYGRGLHSSCGHRIRGY